MLLRRAKNIGRVRCPWCGIWHLQNKLSERGRITCKCGYWTQYLGCGLVCATGIGKQQTKIKCFKDVPKSKIRRKRKKVA